MKKIKECPVCHSVKFTNYLYTQDYFLSKEPFTLSQCEHCGLVFTNPRPEDVDLASYYNSPNYLSHHAAGFSVLRWIYQFLRKRNIRWKYRLLHSFIPKGKILDVGCGTGEVLNFFKHKGWEVRGIEPNEKARLFATEVYDIPVADEPGLLNLPAESFDVISLWHVLEHVPDLNRRMTDLKKLLKPDGLLLIALPNLASMDAKYYGKYWAALDVPRHLYHFSPDSFLELAIRHGYKLMNKIPMKLDAYYISLLSERYRRRCCTYLRAFIVGYHSNRNARRDLQYSSMIYILKK